jgi:hypothetical protein
VRKNCTLFLILSVFIAGCGLGGDIAPPPALATSQAAQSLIQPTESLQPTSPTEAETVSITSTPTGEVQPTESEAELEGETIEGSIVHGSIQGEINNGSEDGQLPDDLEVMLYGFDGEEEAFSKTTTADQTGNYQFVDVEILSSRVFITTVEYQGVVYVSEAAHFSEDEDLDLPITIYASTPDLTNVQLDRMHVILDMPVEGILQVTELWILSNLGDRTISSETGEGVLAVQLPVDAVDLNFESGMLATRYQVTEGGFIDLYPIRPGIGSHEIVFSFNMPFDKSLDFSQPITYPVEAVVMLSPEGIVELTGEGVQDLGLRQLTDMTLHSYSMGAMSPGSVLEFTVKRESGAGTLSIGSSSILEVSVAVLILMVALGGTWFWLYQHREKQEVELDGFYWTEEHVTDLKKTGDRETILQAMADLDDSYGAGEIKSAAYQKYRRALKERLMEIMRHAGND